jgi:hypothetical protein
MSQSESTDPRSEATSQPNQSATGAGASNQSPADLLSTAGALFEALLGGLGAKPGTAKPAANPAQAAGGLAELVGAGMKLLLEKVEAAAVPKPAAPVSTAPVSAPAQARTLGSPDFKLPPLVPVAIPKPEAETTPMPELQEGESIYQGLPGAKLPPLDIFADLGPSPVELRNEGQPFAFSAPPVEAFSIDTEKVFNQERAE